MFCGARANSREHAIPKWIGKRLGIKDFLAGGHLGRQSRKQPISFRSYRARVFCKPCNSHFKHLEDQVIPLLEPMAKGRTLSLGPDSQALLGLWAAKTGVALIAANNVENPDATVVMPLDHRLSIREQGRPSDSVWVGVAPWRGTPVISTGEAVLVEKQQRGFPPPETYVAVLAFASIAFKVVGFIAPPPPPLVIRGWSLNIRQLWPHPARMITWPPPGRPFTPAALGTLLNFVPLRRGGGEKSNEAAYTENDEA